MVSQETVTRLGEHDSLTQTIVRAVADAKGVDPVELEPSLYEVVDPDALESLFGAHHRGFRRADGLVAFRMDGFEVRVRGSGRVSVSPVGGGSDEVVLTE